MNSQSYYEEMQNLYGLSAVKDTIAKWNTILTNLKNKKEKTAMLLPNLFLNSKQGAGKSYFIGLLSEYLYHTKAIPFYGDVRFFEFYLEYIPPNNEMSEINRFSVELRNAAGFRSEYKGVVAIDISEWAKHSREEHFILFLEYLSIIDANVCIVFMANGIEGDKISTIEKVLNSFCRIRTVDFLYPSKEEFADFCKSVIADYSLSLDAESYKLLCKSIERLMESEYFAGYKTINRLCLDIVFELSDKEIEGGIITALHLADFAADSLFIDKLCSVRELSRIGFGGAL